ncbi:PqqD family protein [bacterium D16-51]|nr:PqqD family protein [bacterium D16-59]RKI54028.1 PqqD family protein [bacterium D16-51]
MQQNENFTLRNIGDIYFIIPTAQTTFLSVGQMLTVNETGAYLWNCLKKKQTLEELASSLQSYYNIDYTMAFEDTKQFVEELQKINAVKL